MKSTLKTRFTFILLVVAAAVYAQPKNGYYTAATLDGKNGRELELALKAIVNPHTKLNYDALWNAYKTTDAAPTDSMTVIKSLFPEFASKANSDLVYDMYAWMRQFPKFYSDASVNASKAHSQTGGINREHCVPNSWWGHKEGNDIAYTDLHHLVPSDGCCNSVGKSNYPLGEYQRGMTRFWPTETKQNGDGVTYVYAYNEKASASCGWNVPSTQRDAFGGAEKVFEPADEYKGDFARMYLYVVCTYEGELLWQTADNTMFSNESSVANGATYGYTLIADWAKDLLLKWHRQDPVSDKERKRNNAVESLQKNRNPFIDYPELVEYIWGDKNEETVNMSSLCSAYSNEYKNGLCGENSGETVTKQASSIMIVLHAQVGKPFAGLSYETESNGAVQYTSSNDHVATINAQTGEVTIVGAGETTITFTIAETDVYEGCTEQYKIVVNE